jgi:hypothetical protein
MSIADTIRAYLAAREALEAARDNHFSAQTMHELDITEAALTRAEMIEDEALADLREAINETD